MGDELYTRCPGCTTIFRVTEPQLALRDGQVRCGHCRTVFNGREQLISLAPPADGEQEYDELAQGPPTVTLRSARALDPPPPPMPPPPEPAQRDEPEVDYENRFAWDRAKERRPRTGLYAALVPMLMLALVAAGDLSLSRRDRRELARHQATAHARLRGRGLRDSPAQRRRRAHDRRVGPAERPGAPGPADPDRDAAQPRALPDSISLPRACR